MPFPCSDRKKPDCLSRQARDKHSKKSNETVRSFRDASGAPSAGIDVDELGVLGDGSGCAPSPDYVYPEIYWNAAGAMYAYIFGQLVRHEFCFLFKPFLVFVLSLSGQTVSSTSGNSNAAPDFRRCSMVWRRSGSRSSWDRPRCPSGAYPSTRYYAKKNGCFLSAFPFSD